MVRKEPLDAFSLSIENIWTSYLDGYNGLLNAPTGSGKTYAVWLACLLECLNHKRPKKGLQVLWITPLRALSNDISLALEKAAGEMGTGWEIGVRTGDTPQGIRKKQVGKMPECLITTPESLHVLLSHKNAGAYFRELKAIIVDEWHELLGTKRGVQIELALSKLKTIPPDQPKIWAISATIGNLEEALDVLLGPGYGGKKIIIKADIEKKIAIETIIPDIIEKYPWAGHLGIRLLPRYCPCCATVQLHFFLPIRGLKQRFGTAKFSTVHRI